MTLLLAAGLTSLWFVGDGVAPVTLPTSTMPGGTAVAAAAESSAGAASRQVLPTSRGCYTAPVGTTCRYDLDDRTEFQLTSQEGGIAQSGAMHTRAKVVATVLARRADEVLVQFELADVQFLAADGNPAPEDAVAQSFRAAAATTTVLRQRIDGTPLGFHFADALDGDQRNFLRGTLLLFAAAAPPDELVTRWEGTGVDTTGEFEAGYCRLTAAEGEVAVQREKRRYLVMAGNDTLPEHTVRGHAIARFQLECGWLAAVAVDEHLTTALPLLDLRATARRRAAVVLLASGHVAVTADDTRWTTTTAPAAGHRETVGGHAVATERSLWQQRLQGVTLDDLLRDLAGIVGKEPLDSEALDGAFTQLQWLIRLDGRVAGALGELLAARSLTGTAAAVALSALGAAATEAAQHVLATVRADHSQPYDVREAATVALLQLPDPSRELVAGLVADASHDFDGRANAMLVLGGLAARVAEPLADGRSAAQALLGLERDAAQRNDLPTWLLAVGNLADRQAHAIATRYLDHGDALVRGAAYTALRRVADAAAGAVLIERGLADTDPFVRQEVVRALGHRPEPAAATALQQVAALDADPATRRTALRELARAATPGSSARSALERAAASDADDSVRAFARELLRS